MIAAEIYHKAGVEYLIEKLNALPVRYEVPLPIDYAEQVRYLPQGVTEYYGKFSRNTAPHLVEPLNRLHPDDPCHYLAAMKSVQSAGTTSIAENIIAFWIKHKLGNILYAISNKTVAKIRSHSNLDVMIDYSGLSKLIKPASDRKTKKSKKSGDTVFFKEFEGGIKLVITSYGSIGDFKSNTFSLLVTDDWTEAPQELKDQGDFFGVIEGRTIGIRNFKILMLSTPGRMETCRMYRSYKEGDQRNFNIPCRHCGELQIPELMGGGFDYGLTFNREKNKAGEYVLIPETVRYICMHCKKSFTEAHKQWLLTNGVWRPTAQPIDDKHTSYYIDGLIAPEMFLSWERICQEFINTGFGSDVLKFKNFVINYRGKPWASVKKSLPWEELKAKAENNIIGEVPAGSLVDTIDGKVFMGPLVMEGGADVHKDRIELQVVGFGPGMEKWAGIDYKIFYGDTSEIGGAAWSALHDWVYNHTYNILGRENYIDRVCIDAGYDPKQDRREKDWTGKNNIVYEFVYPRQDRFKAVMGVASEKAIGLVKEVRLQGSRLTKRYDISVSLIKELIMSHIDIRSGVNAIHFPRYQKVGGIQVDIPDEWYKQFMSERYQEIDINKFGWKKIYQRNEVWDTFIYTWAAAEMQGLSSWSAAAWIKYYHTILETEN